MKKKLISAILVMGMVLSMTACGSSNNTSEEATADTTAAEASEAVSEESEAATETEVSEETEAAELEDVTVRIGAMSGPTAMGLVKVMYDSEAGATAVDYDFQELQTEASAFVSPLAKGELDIACIPSNLAAVVYNNTNGGIEVLATVNTGVLNVVERGESVNSIADLAGKDVYMTGEGAVPEYVVRYLLTENGVDPDNDVNIHFCTDTTEALSYVSQDETAIAVLPQPFVTAACAQVEDLRVAVDLNDAWAALNNGCSIITGVVVARTEFVNENPNTIAQFLKDYEQSVQFTNDDVEDAAIFIEQYGIVAKAAIAQKALPGCNLVCMTGDEMKTNVSGFLQILYDSNPKAVGGTMPGDDFYYMPQ